MSRSVTVCDRTRAVEVAAQRGVQPAVVVALVGEPPTDVIRLSSERSKISGPSLS